MVVFIIYILAAYFIGSIPTAIWYGRIFHKTDIRKHGSGNAGATNTIRTFGKKAGILVLIIDITKGSVGVLLPWMVSFITDNPDLQIQLDSIQHPQLALGLAAGLGHIYPIYERFRGGKGVATLFGVILAIDLWVALCTVVSFVILFIITKRVSVGSIISGVAFAVAFIIMNKSMMPADYILVCVFPLLIIYTHRSNIKRLMNGTEPRLSLGKKKD